MELFKRQLKIIPLHNSACFLAYKLWIINEPLHFSFSHWASAQWLALEFVFLHFSEKLFWNPLYPVVIIHMDSLLFQRSLCQFAFASGQAIVPSVQGNKRDLRRWVQQCSGLHGISMLTKYLKLAHHQQDLLMLHSLWHIGRYHVRWFPRGSTHVSCLTILTLGINVQPRVIWSGGWHCLHLWLDEHS